MTNIDNKRINPVEFIEMYEKIQKLSPIAIERVNGFIDGFVAALDITVNQKNQKGA